MAFLLGRQLLCIVGNLTVAEFLTMQRVAYLKRVDGTYYNRFDRGPVTNWLQFWGWEKIAWDQEYHAERLVSCVAIVVQCFSRHLFQPLGHRPHTRCLHL